MTIFLEDQTFDCVVPTGTYEVTEQDPAPNFALDQITCDDTDSPGEVGTRTATYVIDPAETVTCTFTNVVHELSRRAPRGSYLQTHHVEDRLLPPQIDWPPPLSIRRF